MLRTFSKVHGLAGLRCGYALCSPKFRAAVDAVRQPFSVNALAQAAAAEAILHADDVAERVERTIVERIFVEEGLRELGLEPPDSQANFSWVPLGDRDEAEVDREPRPSRASWSAAASRSAAPGTSASPTAPGAENQRFLGALARRSEAAQRSARCERSVLKTLNDEPRGHTGISSTAPRSGAAPACLASTYWRFS